jgi:hypothetical protein
MSTCVPNNIGDAGFYSELSERIRRENLAEHPSIGAISQKAVQ